METSFTDQKPHNFAVICVLGPPGAGKGTLCAHLAQIYRLIHNSVGDTLRDWMRENQTNALAAQIQDKLDNQGFLASDDLNPFIGQAIKKAINSNDPEAVGILIDGFPRCSEQLESFDAWPFQAELPLIQSDADPALAPNKPDIVLSLHVTKENAKARYLKRGRDYSDKKEKFERRFAEYLIETVEVERVYRQRGILIDIDANGTKEVVFDGLAKTIKNNSLWQKVLTERSMGAYFLM